MTTEQLIETIARLSNADDWTGVQHYLRQLKKLMAEEGRPLGEASASRLVSSLADGAAASLPKGPDPYDLVRQIRELAKARPVDRTALDASWKTLYRLLGEQAAPVETAAVHEVLDSLRTARAFDLLAKTADRLLAREPGDVAARIAYGQALADQGLCQAGIAMLQNVAEIPGAPKSAADEAMGLIGRAHKQIYADHVTATAAASHRAAYRHNLERAIASYAMVFDPNRPGETHWPGVNLLALLKLAREDGHRDMANPSGLEPSDIARRMIAALEPRAKTTDEPWVLASLGEAHLGLGNYEEAARYFGMYARDPNTDGFKLGGTVRQLEQIWRLEPGSGGGGPILAVLKAAQISQPDGKFTLPGDSLKDLGKFAGSAEFQEYKETMVPGGDFVGMKTLRMVVERAAGVAAVCDANGRTMGTGFLVRGAELHRSLGNDIYLLTNAHVMTDRKWANHEPGSLDSETARLVLEAAKSSGVGLKFEPRAAWQSPVAEYDATLVRIVDPPADLVTLPIETSKPLKVESTEPPKEIGSSVSVIGHPLGGPLSLSIVGSLSGANGVLVDMGGRAKAGADPAYLHYRAPTEPGNSGSPVFETGNWGVIGLHHMGFNQFQGRPCLGGKAGQRFANEGVCIRSIKRQIEADARAGKLSPGNKR